jgi:hypothetical protein
MQCLWCLIDEIKRPTRAPVCLGDRKISEMVIAGIPGGLTCIWVRERLSGGSAEVRPLPHVLSLGGPLRGAQKAASGREGA